MINLHITEEDYSVIDQAVKRAGSSEVGGIGVIITEDDQSRVIHMRLPEQEVSSGEVDWQDEGISDYLNWLHTPVEKGGAGFNPEGSYGIFSWHSHGNMGVFWSTTDEDFIEKVSLTAPFIFSSVFNTKGESKHRLDVLTDFSEQCDLVKEPTAVTFSSADLIICYGEKASEILNELDEKEVAHRKIISELERDLTENIKSLRAEHDKETEALNTILKNINKDVADRAKERLDEEWTKNVTVKYPYSYAKGHGYPGLPQTSSYKAPDAKKFPPKNHKDWPKKNGNGESDIEDVIEELYECYDTRINAIVYVPLKTIIKDETFIPINDDLPPNINLDDRGSFEDFVSTDYTAAI